VTLDGGGSIIRDEGKLSGPPAVRQDIHSRRNPHGCPLIATQRPLAYPIIDGVTVPFGDKPQRLNTDNHEFRVRIPQLDHRRDVHPGEQRCISPPPARCVSLLNFLLRETHGLAKSIESADIVHQQRATTAFPNWKERFDPSISHPNPRILLPPSDTNVRQEMPLKPEIFHGRGDFVEDIARSLLREETSRICILGPGGMGKTSVSLAVVELPVIKERFPGGNCVWVPCIEATSATLLLEILYTQLQVPGDQQITLEKIISELNALKQPHLILLDNFETPWNAPGGTQKHVSDILRKLAMLSHVAILLTMRGTYPPCDAIKWQSHTIQPTDEAACRHIFYDINPSSKDDPDVDRLLGALGHMPFAVTLMANLGKRGKSTANELLEMWYTSGTDMLSVTNSPEKSMNRSISLSVDCEFVKQDPNALPLLAILSLLPAGTTKQNLRWWATSIKMIPSAIATLSDAGLLVENKCENPSSPVLFVIPVVQSFMQQQGRIAEEIRKQVESSCCEYVLAHACRFDDPTFPKNSKAVAAEDTNIQSILFSSPTSQHIPSDITIEALIAFSWHRCDTKPNLEIAAHLGDHHPAYAHLREAYRLFNTLPPGEVELQRLGGQCGIDLGHTARPVLRANHEAVSLARDVETKCAALSDNIIHGRSLMLLGAVLSDARQPQEALRCLDHARTMLKAAGNTYNLANAYQITSWVHYRQGRLPEALYAVEEGWKYAQLTENVPIQAAILLDFGRILFSTNSDTEAWKYIEISLMKASYIGDRLTVARALEYMGYGYLRRGDYQNAYGAYEAAAEKYIGTVDANTGGGNCKDNMARIKQKQENTGAVIGFHSHSYDFDDTLF
jgi:tetratricopeptide (TPR) repeat protein